MFPVDGTTVADVSANRTYVEGLSVRAQSARLLDGTATADVDANRTYVDGLGVRALSARLLEGNPNPCHCRLAISDC